MRLSEAETKLLASVPEDGFPLGVLAGANPEAVQATALALLRKGLVGVYGLRDDASDLPAPEAEAVLLALPNWTDPAAHVWFLSTTPEGDAVLAALG